LGGTKNTGDNGQTECQKMEIKRIKKTITMENTNSNSDRVRYEEAAKTVQKLKGFYIHATVYVVINSMLIIVKFQNLASSESYFQFENFSTAFFWGIGLVAHALTTFVPHFILGKNWEEQKIKEFIEKEQNETKWE
jgi:hypothetical protein